MSDDFTEPGVLTEDLVGRVLSGRFRVLEAIGQGGAGRVFLGVQEPLGRMVAIKVLRDDLRGQAKQEFTARFEREAAVVGHLNHPNVVTVHDYGTTTDGLRFVVMERLAGPTLSTLVRGGEFLQPRRAARLIAELAKGLAAAHDAGLIHRDVKPHNVIVQEEDGRERPVLLDFGLVKVVSGAPTDSDYSTRAGTYMGTPAYMAPEQAKGEAMDHRVDIYALGCVLYRLLTGVTPYTAEHPLGLAVQHMTEPFPPMSERAPGVRVPSGLEAITRRCMEKLPDDRYPDCRALVAALESWLDEAPSAVALAPRPSGVAMGASVGAVGAGVGLVGVGLGIVALVVALLVVVTSGQPTTAGEEVPPAVLLGGDAPTPDEPVPVVPLAPSGQPAPAESVPGKPVPTEPEPAPPEPVPVEPAPVDPAPVKPAPLEPAPAEPAPSPVPVGEPLPMPVPTRPLPPPPPRPVGQEVVDEVVFSAAHAQRTLDWVNTAEPDALRAAGVYNRGVDLIVAERPFSSLEAFGATKGIGTKTVEAVSRGAE